MTSLRATRDAGFEMRKARFLYFLYVVFVMLVKVVSIETITPLHVGAGAGRGEVDLPVDRDCFEFPFIPASGLKGALKDEFSDDLKSEIFGTNEKAGKMAVQDAYLLAMPARSLMGVWALVTSPLLLKRFKMLAEVAARNDLSNELNDLSKANVMENKILVSDEGKRRLEIDGKIVINEDFELEPIPDQKLQKMGSKFLPDEPWRLCVVSDDVIREIVRTSLLRRARVELKDEEKTVGNGPWEEEDVPPRSFFVNLFCFPKDAEKEMKAFEGRIGSYLVIGGHETLGRGMVRLKEW